MPDSPIPSPYNFVPLSDRVYFPEWAAQVSHDVPFSDGVSGWLEIEIEAMTPIYIRSGSDLPGETPQERQIRLANADWQDFFRVCPGGPYAIPGSTLRGMLRSVVEIASFGKFCGVDRKRFGYRDLNLPDIYNDRLTETTAPNTFRPRAQAGWLSVVSRADGSVSWQIQPCEFARVEQEQLETTFKLEDSLGKPQFAKHKYKTWAPRDLTLSFSASDLKRHRHSDRGRQPTWLEYRLADITENAESGFLVFTGQPSSRYGDKSNPAERKPHQKHQEFIFFTPRGQQPKPPIDVPDDVKANFLFIHSEPDGITPNDGWGFWRRKLEAPTEFLAELPGVPIFYLEKIVLHADGTKSKALSLGLALMFRLPYANDLGTLIECQQPDAFSARSDLAELVFGRVCEPGRSKRGDQRGLGNALKGRLACDTLLEVAGKRPSTAGSFEETVLGQPRPTYYPNYLEQPIRDGGSGRIAQKELISDNGQRRSVPAYVTYADDDAQLRGWKRYPVGSNALAGDDLPKPQTDRVATRFRPLPAGARFSGKLRVHNLRPVELGALIWATTWGHGLISPENQPYRHSLGMAKPYGYGSVRLTIKSWNLRAQADLESLEEAALTSAQREFCLAMEEFRPGWQNCNQLTQLMAMADPRRALGQPGSLEYPQLKTGGHRRNDFADAKAEGLALLPYARPVNSTEPTTPTSPSGPRTMAQRSEANRSGTPLAAAQIQAPVSSDYPTESYFRNAVLSKLTPVELPRLQAEVAKLQKPDNRVYLDPLKATLLSKDMKDIRRRLHEMPWFPSAWLPSI
ncbi:MAG TPA: TIGR03986 family CRISPR-associated RAMP protein [Verrucomicrobiota bacterium]|nr:TIGR03986 family CRISPR-associated RAMP protein [Verrucomicrobiota bacterium]